MTTPTTQTTYPGKAVIRTVVQMIIGLAVVMPVLITESGLDTSIPVVAGALALSAIVTRIMTFPGVNLLLARIGLGSAPKKVIEP